MTRRTRFALLMLASSALVAPASANTVLFSTGVLPNGTKLPTGAPPSGPVTVAGGVTQIQTTDGDVVSFVGDGSFDASGGTVRVTDGRVTLSGGLNGRARLNFGGNVSANVAGQNATASFRVDAGNIVSGRGLGGTVSVTANGVTRSFDLGQAFAVAAGAVPRPIATPGAAPIAAAIAIPDPATPTDQSVTGDVTTGTPLNLATLPATNPLTTFEALAAFRGAFGGFRFPGVTTAFFDVNLASVRAGQALGAFTPAAGAAATNAYLAAIRNGTAPGSATANAAYQAALLNYFGADGLPTGTSQATRDLLARYQAVIAAGGSAAGFSAASLAASLSAWQRYLAAGGNPATYTAATSALIAAYNQAFTTLGAGNASAADIANIEAQRALQAALGTNANLSVANAAAILSAYFGSLGTGTVATGGLTTAQLQALLNYYSAQSTGIAIDAATAAAIANYQGFIAGGGSFGQPPQTLLESARLLSAIVAARRNGQAATFLGARDAGGLDNLLQAIARNGIPAGLTAEERERVEAALAFFNGGGGGVFETPGQRFANASVTSSLTNGNYVRATIGRIESSLLAMGGTESAPVTFSASGVPLTGAVAAGNPVLMEGRSGPGYFVGRFGPSAISTTGQGVALIPLFAGTRPTTGTATFNLLAHTTPQYADGRLVSAATLTGSVRLNFGTGLSFTTTGNISVTDPLGVRTYAFDQRTGSNAVTATNADLCTTATACRINTTNYLGGTSGELVAGSWLITDTTSISAPVLGGAWVFGGTLPATTPPPATGMLPPLPTRTGPLNGVRSDFATGTYVGAFGIAAGQSSFAPRQVEFNASGEPRRSLGLWNLETAAIGQQHLRQNDWLMARYILNGQHRLDAVIMRPLTVAIPLTGRAEFQIIGNLELVPQNASITQNQSLLDGRMSLAFGTTPLWGLDAALRVNYATGVVDTYRFGSAASFTNPGGQTQYNQANGELRTGSAAFEVAGPGCGTGCGGSLNFALGGDIGNLFGGTFQVSAAGNPLFLGSAMAQQVATGTTVAPTGTAGRTGETAPGGLAIYSNARSTPSGGSVTLDNAGQVLSFTVPPGVGSTVTQTDTRTTASVTVQGADGTAFNWARIAGGNMRLTTSGGTNQELELRNPRYYYWGVPVSNLPTTGTATYNLLADLGVIGTINSTATGSVTAATLGVAFGSTTRVGATVGFSFGGSTYELKTQDTAARQFTGAASPGLALDPNSMIFGGAVNNLGGACTTSAVCSGGINGQLFGTGASHAGIFFTVPTSSTVTVQGAAALRLAAAGVPGTGGTGSTGSGATTPPVATAFAVIRPEGQNSTQATLQTAAGVLTAFGLNLADGATSTTRRGTATAEGGSSSTQVIGWTRWFGGRATTELSTGGTAPDDITAAGGRHFIWGTRATNLPTAGTANYDMLGATRVTTTDDRPLGTVDTANLRVAFGSVTRVGVEIGATIDGQSYAIGNFGGVATPNMQVAAATMEFGGDATVTGNGCTSSTCSGVVRGVLAGDGASHAGVAFTFPLAPGRSPAANGAVAFVRRP